MSRHVMSNHMTRCIPAPYRSIVSCWSAMLDVMSTTMTYRILRTYLLYNTVQWVIIVRNELM